MSSPSQEMEEKTVDSINVTTSNATTMATPASFVWVQLYYEDKEEPKGRAFEITPVPEDVADLTEQVKAELSNALSHCGASDLYVYSPGTKPPFHQDEAIDPDQPVPTDTASRRPLIVVASPPQSRKDHIDDAMILRIAEEAAQKLFSEFSREEPQRTLSYVSKSQAFSNDIVKGRISFGQDFFFNLVEPVDSTAFGDVAPKSTEDETKIHHPYFLREVTKLVDSATAVGRQIHQQLFWTKAGHWLSFDNKRVAGVEPDFSTIAVDRSRKNTDMGQFYVGRPEDGTEKPSKYDVVLVFEQIKTFVETDQMEAIDYAERLLRIQRGRGVVYAALFHCCEDDKSIRWMKVTPRDGHYETEVSRPESLSPKGLGQRQLLTVLSKTSEELGRDYPDLGVSDSGESIKISYLLGSGATANVYVGSVGERKGVLKVLKYGFEHLAASEADILRHLVSCGTPFLSKCDKIKDDVLYFDEVLSPVRALTYRHVDCLLQCLKHAHGEARVVHRDFHPGNIMETAGGEVRIIDWAFAHRLDDILAPRFEGTFQFASDEVLDAAMNEAPRMPKPEDDLETFARVVYAMTVKEHWRLLASVDDGDFAEVKQLWQSFKDKKPRQADMFIAAASLDYEALKEIVMRPASAIQVQKLKKRWRAW